MTRRAVVLAALVLAGLVVGCAAPAWVRATTSSPSVAVVQLSVTGTAAAPTVGAGALVVGAAALALALGRRWGRRVALLGLAVGGLLVAASAVSAIGSARSAALSSALEAVGVGALTGEPRVTPWPWVTAGLGLGIVALAVLGGVVSRRWTTSSQRFEAGAATAAEGAGAGRLPPTGAGRLPPTGGAEGSPPGHDDLEVWEALTRGEDPT